MIALTTSTHAPKDPWMFTTRSFGTALSSFRTSCSTGALLVFERGVYVYR